MLRGVVLACAVISATLVASVSSGTKISPTHTTRDSEGSGGVPADGISARPAISTDGRFVAFQSNATTLVGDDRNRTSDIFVKDRATRATVRVSLTTFGAEAAGFSLDPAISGDGRFVSFTSNANNMFPGDPNSALDIFVRNRDAAGIGIYDASGNSSLRLASIAMGGTWANGPSSFSDISEDGRYVAFVSSATNLVVGDTNGMPDIFRFDLVQGSTVRVSEGENGSQAAGSSAFPSISSDGSFVAFQSAASNLVPGDTNGVEDVFVRDLSTGGLSRISLTDAGTQADFASQSPAISSDGRYVVFHTKSALVAGDTNSQVDVYRRDTVSGTSRLASIGSSGALGNQVSAVSSISNDGRYVAFVSLASTIGGHPDNSTGDVFVHDFLESSTTMVSRSLVWIEDQGGGSTEPLGDSFDPEISPDGRFVTFGAWSFNLTAGDLNNTADVFTTGPAFFDTPAGRTGWPVIEVECPLPYWLPRCLI